jgi:hypothetical protein
VQQRRERFYGAASGVPNVDGRSSCLQCGDAPTPGRIAAGRKPDYPEARERPPRPIGESAVRQFRRSGSVEHRGMRERTEMVGS